MQIALESALLPPLGEIDDDFFGFLNSRCNWTANSLLEATTRGDAATQASTGPTRRGRVPRAWRRRPRPTRRPRTDVEQRHTASSSAGRAPQVRPGHRPRRRRWRSRHSPTATWTRSRPRTRRGGGSARRPPRLRIFDGWRLMIVSTATIDEVVDETNELLHWPGPGDAPARRRHVDDGDRPRRRPLPHHGRRRRRLPVRAARRGVGRARNRRPLARGVLVGVARLPRGHRVGALAISRPSGCPPRQRHARRRHRTDPGRPRDHRRPRSPAGASRPEPTPRPWIHEESSFLVPFAWLAIEQGELERAASLLDVVRRSRSRRHRPDQGAPAPGGTADRGSP